MSLGEYIHTVYWSSPFLSSEGLGRQSQGRVEPVEIVILPPGKSLDACAALREGKKLKGDRKGKRNRGRLKKEKRARLAAAEAEVRAMIQ